MRKGFLAKELIEEAAILFDTFENGLAQSARKAGKRGFASAGEWMREALGVIRNKPLPDRRVQFRRLGLVKYGLATGVATVAGILGWWKVGGWILPLAIALFYVVEVQMVFLFPLALDGFSNLIRQSLGWTRRAGGTWCVLKTILPLAATMLLGGFWGRGFLRSWCLGCLAVLIWYERLRNAPDRQNVPRSRLEIAASQPLQVRNESLQIFNQSPPFRLVYASDLHFKGEISRRVAEQIVGAVQQCGPDLILLGGDLVDTKAGLPLLTWTVAKLSAVAPTWAVAGNHDDFAGLPAVRSAVEDGRGKWLENQSILFDGAGRKSFFLDGNAPQKTSGNQPRILCAHNPEIFPEATEFGYSLVLAGHLHGGQIVLAERSGRLFPAAWCYRWNGLRFSRKASTMFVSRGASDTLPLRWNCPREILLCELY